MVDGDDVRAPRTADQAGVAVCAISVMSADFAIERMRVIVELRQPAWLLPGVCSKNATALRTTSRSDG